MLLSRFELSQKFWPGLPLDGHHKEHREAKEMVQNLAAVRFSNAILEPLWNRHHVASVSVTFKVRPSSIEAPALHLHSAACADLKRPAHRLFATRLAKMRW